jgi:hypothetical protein
MKLKNENQNTQFIENELDNIIFDLYKITEMEKAQIMNSEKVQSINSAK